jgi:hypothetical protein
MVVQYSHLKKAKPIHKIDKPILPYMRDMTSGVQVLGKKTKGTLVMGLFHILWYQPVLGFTERK